MGWSMTAQLVTLDSTRPSAWVVLTVARPVSAEFVLVRPLRRSAPPVLAHHAPNREAHCVELYAVPITMPDDANVIAGQAHLIKTIVDLHEALAAFPRFE